MLFFLNCKVETANLYTVTEYYTHKIIDFFKFKVLSFLIKLITLNNVIMILETFNGD